jgi:2-polyprenyl-3-methyl-5-hydroxy-6-metoxy-1,4-benzoquinol methylase
MNYKEHYRVDAETFDYWADYHFTPTEHIRDRMTLRLARIQPGEMVLDVGSGNGWFSLQAASLGAEVIAMDLSEANLARIKQSDGRIQTWLADALEPPATEDKYDLIVALEVLEHLVDPGQALAAWKNMLKPSGRLLLTVPYNEQIRYSLCIHCNKKTPHNAHLHSFGRESLAALVIKNGMKIARTELFAHKLQSHLRLDRLTRHLPFPLWHGIDRLCGITGDKYNYLVLLCSL